MPPLITIPQNQLEDSDVAPLEAAFESAYLQANQDLTSEDIEVKVTIVDNELEDQDG